jgi:glucose-6-phosphate isomerase
LDSLEVPHTAYLSNSNSGNTLETISQTLLCLELCEQHLHKKTASHWFMISDPYENPLTDLAKEIGAVCLDHPKEIGGRYAGFTSVGLLPAAFAGLDIRAFRKGAVHVIETLKTQPFKSPVIQGSAMHACFLDKAISLSVILPYIERLSAFTAWYSQMLSESLGKNNKGITPIRAIGPLDQHSQLQLFLDGPQDKLITVISQKQHSAKCVIKNPFSATQSFSYLEGKTLADILHAEHQATIETLHENQRPLRHFAIQTLDEETLGALMMHIMLEVICLSQLMKIDPFNQPAVEQGKIRTRHLLAQKEDII